jgi:hypothetical protein
VFPPDFVKFAQDYLHQHCIICSGRFFLLSLHVSSQGAIAFNPAISHKTQKD